MYPNHPGLERRWALVIALWAGAAWAHDADVIYAQLTIDPAGGFTEAITLTAGTLSQLAPIDADGDGTLTQADLDARAAAIAAGVWDQVPLSACTRSGEQAFLRDGYVELVARFQCSDGALWQDFRILRVLTTNYRVVLGRQVDGEAGQAFAQGNVQRLLVRPEPAVPSAGFEAGLAAPLIWFEPTLLLFLALLLSGTVSAAANRWGVLVLGHAAVALVAGGRGIPVWVGMAVLAAGGSAYALAVLMRGAERLPLVLLAIAAVGDGLRADVGRSPPFEGGRALAFVLLALVGVPVARMIGRRPVLKRRLVITLACVSLAALGFSLVQSVHGF